MSVMTAGEQRRRAGSVRGRRLVTAVPGQPNVMAGPWPGAGERHRAMRRTPDRSGRSAAAELAMPRTPADAPQSRTPVDRATAAGRAQLTHPGRNQPAPAGGAMTGRAGAGRALPVARTQVRLTRRGRVVVAILITVGMALVAALSWLAGTAQADAAGSGVPSSAVYHSLHSVVVLPGQSLWSIASKYEPGSDPRDVIQQIIDINALGSTSVQPGQRLWLPRG